MSKTTLACRGNNHAACQAVPALWSRCDCGCHLIDQVDEANEMVDEELMRRVEYEGDGDDRR